MAFSNDKVFNTSFALDLGNIASGSTPTGVSVISLLADGSIYYRQDLNAGWSGNDRLFIYNAETTYGSWSYSGNNGTFTNGVWFDGVDDGINDTYFTPDISAVGDTERTAGFSYYNFAPVTVFVSLDGTVNSAVGTGWEYSINGGASWSSVDVGVTVLDSGDQIRFTPTSGYNPATAPSLSWGFGDGSLTYNSISGPDFDVDPATIAINSFDTSLGTWQYSTDGGTTWLLVDTGLVNSNTNELSLVLSGTDLIRMVPFGDLSGTLNTAITFYAAEYDEVLGSIGGYTLATGASFSSGTESAELTVNPPPTSDNAPMFRVDYGEVLVNLDDDNNTRSTDEGRDVVVLDDGSILVAGGAYRWDSSDYTYKESASGYTTGLTIDASYTTGGASISPDDSLSSAAVTLTASHGALTDPTYKWYKNGIEVVGATGSSYDLVAGDAGGLFSVVVTHDSGVLLSEEYASVTEEKFYEGDYGLVKLNANGTLDTTFSGDGILLYDGGANDAAYALDLQADGQIWVAGYSGTDTDSDGFNDYNRFRLLEIDPAGSSVTSHDYTPFSDGGPDFDILDPFTPEYSFSDGIQDIEVLLGSDWIIAGGSSGWSEGSGDADFAVRYYNQNGALQSTSPWWYDTSYSGDLTPVDPAYNPYYLDNAYNPGDYYTYPASYTQQGLTTLTEDASGRIVAAGTLTRANGDGYHPYTDFYVARFNTAGQLDSSYSANGWLNTEFTGDPKDVDIPLSIISLSDGRVLIVGRTDVYVGDSILVSLQEGEDANFGQLGTVDTGADGLNDRYQVSLTVDNNGEYGTDGNTTANGLSPLETDQAWRYQWQYSSNGSTWGDIGGVTTNNYYPAVLTDTNGFVRVQILRVDTANSDAVLDTYNSQRYVVDFIADYDTQVSLLRTELDGDLDPTFGGGDGKILLDAGVGDAEFIPQRAVLDNDGNILVVGYSQGVETISLDIGGVVYEFDFPTHHMQVIRLDPDGALDTSFGDGGKVVLPVSDSTDYAYGVTVQPDNRIVITGSALAETDTDLAVVRLNADGTYDSGFGGADAMSDGEVTFVENGPAVVLFENLGVYDTEQDLKGDYDGATLVVERTATVDALDVSTPAAASSDDQFTGSGDLSLSAGNVIFDGTTVGTYNTGSLATGTLDITFNSSATPGDVNGVLSGIAYSNSNDNPDSVLSPPDSVVLTFTFTDEATVNSSNTSKSDTVSRTVNITPANDAPSPFTVDLTWTGTADTENSTVTAAVTVDDPDGNGTLTYQWQSSSDSGATWQSIGGASGASFTPNDPQVGKLLQVVVSYVDGGGTTESTESSATGAIANVNDLPTGFSAGIIGDTEGDTLALNIGAPSDPDGVPALPAGYSYQWQTSPTGAAGTWTDISGAIGSTLLADNDVSGRYVRAMVSYEDLGSGDAANTTVESTYSGGVFIEAVNDAPVNFTVSISGTVEENQVLTANAAVDSDGDGLPTLPAGFTYQWQSSPNGISGWTNIAGATFATFTPDDPQVGQYLQVIAKYQDNGGTVEQTTSAATAAVTGVNDAPSGLPTITGTQVVGYTLGVNTAGISDADGLSGSFSYEWYREDGATDILLGSSSTYTLTAADVGEQVYVRASYTDLQLPDAVESVDSALSSVIGTSNTTGGITISNDGTPAQGETVAAVSTLSDPDGLGPFSYQWYRSGDATYDGGDTVIASATASSYTLADADTGNYVFVVVSYTDGLGNSEVIPSSALGPIADTNELGEVVINGSPVPLSTLGLSISDPDGVGGVDSYLWERSSDGNSWSTIGTGSTQALAVGDLGYQVRVTVTYDDLDPNLDQVVVSNSVLVVPGQPFAGMVYFWNVPHTLLADVAVTASADGVGTLAGVTDANGEYGFGYMPDAEYSLTAAKAAASVGNAVTAGDATAILKMLVGINPNADGSELSPYQVIAADANQDGHVSILDAIDVLRMAVNAPNAPTDAWLFIEEGRTFWDAEDGVFTLNIDDADWGSSLTYDPATDPSANLVGVVKGDVDGSWGSQPAVSGLPGLPDSYFTDLASALGVPVDLWGL